MKKKLLIDLTPIYKRKLTGVEIYGIDLYNTLLKNKSKIDIIPIFKIENSLDNNVNIVLLNSRNRFSIEQLYMPLAINKLKPDYVWYPIFPPGYLTYFLKPAKTKIIVTIHDSVPWNFYSTMSLKAKLYLKPLYNIALKKADYIVTISEAVKSELLKIHNRNIINLSNCISKFFEEENISNINTNILDSYNIKPKNYILSVSTIEPRKNIIYLLQIYKRLIEKGFSKKLILVGRKGWNIKEIDNLYNELKEYIIFTNYLSIDDLITLYKNCASFVLLSIYEGFGRPPLEALSCGAKIYVSDIPIFYEILKSNAIYLPLNNIEKASEIILNTIDEINSPINDYNYHRWELIIDDFIDKYIK